MFYNQCPELPKKSLLCKAEYYNPQPGHMQEREVNCKPESTIYAILLSFTHCITYVPPNNRSYNQQMEWDSDKLNTDQKATEIAEGT